MGICAAAAFGLLQRLAPAALDVAHLVFPGVNRDGEIGDHTPGVASTGGRTALCVRVCTWYRGCTVCACMFPIQVHTQMVRVCGHAVLSRVQRACVPPTRCRGGLGAEGAGAGRRNEPLTWAAASSGSRVPRCQSSQLYERWRKGGAAEAETYGGGGGWPHCKHSAHKRGALPATKWPFWRWYAAVACGNSDACLRTLVGAIWVPVSIINPAVVHSRWRCGSAVLGGRICAADNAASAHWCCQAACSCRQCVPGQGRAWKGGSQSKARTASIDLCSRAGSRHTGDIRTCHETPQRHVGVCGDGCPSATDGPSGPSLCADLVKHACNQPRC